jgi:hypothetical protein
VIRQSRSRSHALALLCALQAFVRRHTGHRTHSASFERERGRVSQPPAPRGRCRRSGNAISFAEDGI